MKFKSISDLAHDIQWLLPMLPRDIGIVYGVPRSGLLPASILATALGAELGVLGGQAGIGERRKHFNLPMGRKILLVDDTIRTGRSMKEARALLEAEIASFYTCAVYANDFTKDMIDFYSQIINGSRMFQWNFCGIKATKDFCWDLDGAICTDPTMYDDDGEQYQREILHDVRPLYLPQVEVRAIITNRIERWRPETEAWLKVHGVRYQHLIMQPYPTAEERRRNSKPHEYKANWLTELNGSLFVESDEKVAVRISELTGRPTLSIETMRLHGENDGANRLCDESGLFS